MAFGVVCANAHTSLLPFTLQVVNKYLLPETLHSNMKVSSGQVGGAAVNCAVTSPGEKVHADNYMAQVCSLVFLNMELYVA